MISPGVDCSEMDDAAARMMGNWRGSRVWGEEAREILSGEKENVDEAQEAVDLSGGVINDQSASSEKAPAIHKLKLLQDNWELVKNSSGEVR